MQDGLGRLCPFWVASQQGSFNNRLRLAKAQQLQASNCCAQCGEDVYLRGGNGLNHANEFDQLFFKLSRDYRTYMESELPGGVTEGQLTVLEYALGHERIKPSDFTDYLATTPAAVTTLLDRMERNLLIERERDEKDRRIVWVHITNKGRELAKQGQELRNAFFAGCLDRISSHNQQLFVYLFGKVSTGMVKEPI